MFPHDRLPNRTVTFDSSFDTRMARVVEFFFVKIIFTASDLPGKLTVARPAAVDNPALAAVEHHRGLSTGTPTVDLRQEENVNIKKSIFCFNSCYMIPLFAQH